MKENPPFVPSRFRLPDSFGHSWTSITVEDGKLVDQRSVTERNLANLRRIEEQRRLDIRRTPFNPQRKR